MNKEFGVDLDCCSLKDEEKSKGRDDWNRPPYKITTMAAGVRNGIRSP